MTPATWLWRTGDPVAPGPAVVFDVDGVLADSAHRRHLIAGAAPDWEAFFAACGGDALIAGVAGTLDALDPAVRVVLLTSRPIAFRPQTVRWLESTELRWDLLIMRLSREAVSSADFKTAEARRLLDAGFDVRVVFDDDGRNVAAFRDLGLSAVHVHSGYYD